MKVSLFFIVFSEMHFPISRTMLLVVGPNTPEVSIATGSNCILLTNSGYLLLLAFSNFAVAWPTLMAVSLTELIPKVLTQISSQQSDLPQLKI